MLLYMRALKLCHLSLCIPFLAFTPVFLILTGWLLLGEGLNLWGVTGTLMIAGGSYILGLGVDTAGQVGIFAPLKALAREPGARLMFMVAAIYSLTAALFKLAILHSDPDFFGVAYPLILIVLLVVRLSLEPGPVRPSFKAHYGWWLVMGFCFALSIITLANGLKLAPAAYLIAVKRMSLLMSVTLGGLWLQERPFLPRLWEPGSCAPGWSLLPCEDRAGA